MAFNQSTFASVGAQSSDTPAIYSYKTTDDIPTVQGSGYFADKANQLEPGDFIFVQAAGGSSVLLEVDTNRDTGVPFDPSGVVVPQNRIVVNSKDDLPSPVGGVITLSGGIQYLFGNDVDLGADRLVLGSGTSIAGLETISITISYSGTGDLLTWVDATVTVRNIAFSLPSGRLFNGTNSGQVIRMQDVVVVNCDRIGVFSGTPIPRFTFFTCLNVVAGGIDFGASTVPNLLYGPGLTNITAGILFDLGTATFDTLTINAADVDLGAGATFLSGLASSGNINTGGIGAVNDCRIDGAGTILSGVDPQDVRWEFNGSDDIQDTAVGALAHSKNNALATTITTVNTPVKINAAWTTERQSKFTADSTGRLTYNGEKDLGVTLIITCTAQPTSGTNKDYTVYVAKGNGGPAAVIADSGMSNRADSGNPKNTSLAWSLTMQQGDFVEVWIENNTDAQDFVVSDVIGAASKVG